jgi:hypothetical protein
VCCDTIPSYQEKDKKSINFREILAEVQGSTEAMVVAGGKVTASKMGTAELHDLCHWAFLSQLLLLRYYQVLMPLFMRIKTSQLNNWHTNFQSANKVLVTSSVTFSTESSVLDGFH